MSYSKDSGVDYKVEDVKPDRGINLLFWHKALYVILIFVILASFATIVIQAVRISNLEKEKADLEKQIEDCKKQSTPAKPARFYALSNCWGTEAAWSDPSSIVRSRITAQ